VGVNAMISFWMMGGKLCEGGFLLALMVRI